MRTGRVWVGYGLGLKLALFLTAITLGARASTLTNVQNVFLILMENVTWSEIKGSTNAPFINHVLLPLSSYCDNFRTAPNTSGSLPQYLWLEAGTNFGITDSADPIAHHLSVTNHLTFQMETAGISWKAYEESISGTVCPVSSSGLYAAFHNPFVYFDDIYLNSQSCSNHIRPYSEFWRDLTNNATPRYCFITPNLCDDMHNSSGCASSSRIRNGDDWLANEVPKILASAAYQAGGAVIITWDEGTGGAAGPFGTIVLSPWAKGSGYLNTNVFDHASTLRTIQEIFGVRPFLNAAARAASLEDLFLPDVHLSLLEVTPNGFAFNVMGVVPGKTNWIQASTNLNTWVDLLTNVLTTNSFRFVDTNLDPVLRFYRFREQP